MAEYMQRTVKLHCPSLAKTIHFALSWDDQKLDIGCIARAFGMDPSTVKINGHFISRGVDLVSSSVTWRSLLSFFSSKGLSTGKDDKDAILVDGKLSKVGSKRGHVCRDDESGIFRGEEHVGVWDNRELGHGEKFLVGNKKLKQSSSGSNCQGVQMLKFNSVGLKRRQLPPPEDFGLLKKLKISDKCPGEPSDFQRIGKDLFGNISRSQFTCSYVENRMKRTRGDEDIVASPCKKIR